MGDMDILVQPAHVSLMAEALRTQGFRAIAGGTAARPPSHLPPTPAGSNYRWNSTGRSARMMGEPAAPLLKGIWDDALVLDVTGVRLSVMARPAPLPYLCAHWKTTCSRRP